MAKIKEKEKIQKTEDRIVAVESALGKGEQFIQKNKNLIFYVLLGILLVVGGYMAYKKYIAEPNEREAQAAMFTAEHYFSLDSLDLALNGDQNFLGFLGIIDEYGSTKAGNLAHYYAGSIFMKQGQFDAAIEQLEDFDSDDQIIGPMGVGMIGDAYMELNDNAKALEYYIKASEKQNNDFTTPMFLLKAAWVCEIEGDYTKAVEYYEKIKKEHYKSFEARDIDKYIARAKGLSGQS
jgi:tetratricopeptide (TPR) repeat protein